MGTEILRPHDCLIKQTIFYPKPIHHRNRGCYGNGHMNPRFGNKKSPAKERRFENDRAGNYDDLKNNCNINSGNLVIGRVRILKRGESQQQQQTKKAEGIDRRRTRRISADDVIMSRINRLGTDSLMDQKKIRLEDLKGDGVVDLGFMTDVYAGSAFSMSPSPRSLPLPSFFIKIQASETVDDSATRDLRRLLRLE